MKNGTTLLIQSAASKPQALAELMDATKGEGGKLNILVVEPVALIPPYTVGAVPYIPVGWNEEREATYKQMAEAQDALRIGLVDAGLSGEVDTLGLEPSAIVSPIAARCMSTDMAVLRNDLRVYQDTFRNAAYGVLFHSPAPLLINSEANAQSVAPKRVLVSWNNSLSCARAVHAALPLLKDAVEVTVVSFDPRKSVFSDGSSPIDDFAEWLSHHGCAITVQEVATGGKSVADAIVAKAKDVQADLVVMGAYGRSRLNEAIFGGTTRSMLEQTEVAVLMAH